MPGLLEHLPRPGPGAGARVAPGARRAGRDARQPGDLHPRRDLRRSAWIARRARRARAHRARPGAARRRGPRRSRAWRASPGSGPTARSCTSPSATRSATSTRCRSRRATCSTTPLYRFPGIDGPVTTVKSSRGCPLDCSFCGYTLAQGLRFRFRSPEHVARRADRPALRNHGLRHVVFRDPIFTTRKDRVHAICDGILEHGLTDLEWQCETAVKTLDRPLLEKMAAAGCKHISLGVESGNAEIQKKHCGNKLNDLDGPRGLPRLPRRRHRDARVLHDRLPRGDPGDGRRDDRPGRQPRPGPGAVLRRDGLPRHAPVRDAAAGPRASTTRA